MILFYVTALAFLTASGLSGQDFPEVPLKFPWAGGMNSCQFGPVDLNLDGKSDLIIFDRHGNRILPFVNDGSAGEINYSYHPEFASRFPDLHDWVLMKDYNGDGKPDIFTYSLGGTRVFRNVSDTILKFELVTDLLTSYYYSGKVGILITPVDYPAIEDIDGDGDLDLLTFFGLGSFVEYHRNLSMEKYGTCDSLDYRLWDKCWGDFKESESGNKITLDISCPYKRQDTPGLLCSDDGPKHTGSTLLAIDLNGDGVRDLLIGDIDYPELIALMNGGTPDSAHITGMDSTFPGNPVPVRIFSFPAASFLDLNHDGACDLVVSPFDPTLFKTENKQSCWYYENRGTDVHPDFQFRTKNFFQNEMIDVGTNAFPVVCDVNTDGLPDLLIGNYGIYDTSYYQQGTLHSEFISRIAWYKNMGTPDHPSFHLVTDDFASLSGWRKVALYPAFGDPDGDGDADLIAGNEDGSLTWLENLAGPGSDPLFSPPDFHYKNLDAGDNSTPQLFDLDRDGLEDLLIGNRKGRIVYYHNEGSSASPLFVHVTDSLGHVNVTNPAISYDGFSTPCFFRDASGKTALVTGCEEGILHLFTEIDGNLTGTFKPSDDSLFRICGTPLPVRYGYRTAAAVFPFQDPATPDLIVGNFSGGLNYFTSSGMPGVYTGLGTDPGAGRSRIRVFPNPAGNEIQIHFEDATDNRSCQAFLYNPIGQLLFRSGELSGNPVTLRLDQFQEGFYFLVLRSADTTGNPSLFATKIILIR